MRIKRIDAIPIRLPRDLKGATGTAGSPTVLAPGSSDYRWSEVYPCLYSVHFETAVIRVELDDGLIGWGESQAPLAPEVVCTIIDRLLKPVLLGEEFDGSTERIEQLWDRMYSTMRVRGQTGGFMMDAIAGIDIALWDLAGKIQNRPVSQLLTNQPKTEVPAYLSGISRGSLDTFGFPKVKLFFDTHSEDEFFAAMDSLPSDTEIAVDALWRHTPETAIAFGKALDQRKALWFEAPLLPEDAKAHGRLTQQVTTPIAIGESYRTCSEMKPFFEASALRFYQPDLGRTGLTEGRRLAELSRHYQVPIVPHVSIAFGPQLAAALHYSAAFCNLTEYNPSVLSMANRYLRQPIQLKDTSYVVPQQKGLGVDLILP